MTGKRKGGFDLHAVVEQLNRQRILAYEADPGLLREHFGIEENVLAGGYGYRQVLELVQNGADAILEGRQEQRSTDSVDRIHVLLRGTTLYVANTGAPLSEAGVDALLRAHSSPKRGDQIGRFGLGFKSLLNLNGAIDVFTRRSGAIRFDPELCKRELQDRFSSIVAPRLRLAWPLGNEERSEDPFLAELAWAETVVRAEVGSAHHLENLQREIDDFPPEFLLFFPVPTVVTLSLVNEDSREISVEHSGDERILYDGAEQSRWRLFEKTVTITDQQAIADATDVHRRDSTPVAWAMPLDSRREEAGRFWAFFPTQTPTYLPGILNAPWKLNSDRNAIIGGDWNRALMDEAAVLVAGGLPALSVPDDPGRPLDAFPRQMGQSTEIAGPLVRSLWSYLCSSEVIPDSESTLRSPRALYRHPGDQRELAEVWQSLLPRESGSLLVHWSCLDHQRASRLNELAKQLGTRDGFSFDSNRSEEPELRRMDDADWFDLVASAHVPSAHQVLELVEDFLESRKEHERRALVKKLIVVPTDDGELAPAPECVLAAVGTEFPGRKTVASELAELPQANRILREVLHVAVPGDEAWIDVLVEMCEQAEWDSSDDWERFWSTLRSAPPTARTTFLKQWKQDIRLRRRDGTWDEADNVLMPGSILQAEDPESDVVAMIDVGGFHSGDSEILVAMGISDAPTGFRLSRGHESVLGDWLSRCRRSYKNSQSNAASWNYLQPEEFALPVGLHFFELLTGIGRSRLTSHFLKLRYLLTSVSPLRFGHRSVPTYPSIEVPHPLPWVLVKYGTVWIGGTSVRLSSLLARRDCAVIRQLSVWSAIEPYLKFLDSASVTVIPDKRDIEVLWRATIKELATPEALADDRLADLWRATALESVVPDEFHLADRTVLLSDTLVCSSPDLTRRLRSLDRFIVTLDEESAQIWMRHGARDLFELVVPEWREEVGELQLLVEVVPEIALVLSDAGQVEAQCQVVAGLSATVDGFRTDMPCLLHDGRLVLDMSQLAECSRIDRLRVLLSEAAAAGWLAGSVDDAIDQLGDSGVDERRSHVAAGHTLAEKLSRAVGGRDEALRSALGAIGEMGFLSAAASTELAELVLAQLGPTALQALSEELENEGLRPPNRWGTTEAREFVASLGFPPEFAASAETRREPELLVSGPIELPELHDFQDEVLSGIRGLFSSRSLRRRAVVSLPTGGGKTRVTVEAAVRLVLAPEGDRRSVLWIAQTDELCEQAVQAFRQVWVNLGSQRTDLRVVRLWGGNPSPSEPIRKGPIVVVASIQTLNSRMHSEHLGWLKAPGLVVVDECHHAITGSYTNVLRWLDAEPAHGSRKAGGNEPAILGLSATPFRADNEESRRLAKRFDNRWLPSNQEALHERLRRDRVLAHVTYSELQSGVGLSSEEKNWLNDFGETWEGLDFENFLEAMNQRLGSNAKRNERLMSYLCERTEQSILFFANSVSHAEEMAARLNLAGVPAAAVSGSTPSSSRRYFLDRFHRQDIRVLCNHTVLSTGFDSPKTDLVLIARQVFSPVRYMQMVGRGLRGPKNGGTEHCSIVTVMDNLGRFRDRHPYYYCRDLYE